VPPLAAVEEVPGPLGVVAELELELLLDGVVGVVLDELVLDGVVLDEVVLDDVLELVLEVLAVWHSVKASCRTVAAPCLRLFTSDGETLAGSLATALSNCWTALAAEPQWPSDTA
jgi:hypothetical protein